MIVSMEMVRWQERINQDARIYLKIKMINLELFHHSGKFILQSQLVVVVNRGRLRQDNRIIPHLEMRFEAKETQTVFSHKTLCCARIFVR